MAEDQYRWFNVNAAETAENYSFADEALVSCQLTKIFHYSEKRNAYWNTTSNLWPGDRAFHFNLDVIKYRIESDRKMGSYFSIHEIPCLVLKGKDDAIVLIDKEPRSSFPLFLFGSLEKLQVKKFEIKETFDYIKSQFLVYGFIMESKHVPVFDTPFHTYDSYSTGSNYLLNYSKAPKKIEIEHLLKSLQFFHKILGG
jgi:hypothetical protein